MDSITSQLEQVIRERFSVTIPVFVISQRELEDILRHAPQWWGGENKEIYDNLIFIMKPATFQEVIKEIGTPRRGWSRYRIISKPYSGRLAEKNIKRQTGGQKQPAQMYPTS